MTSILNGFKLAVYGTMLDPLNKVYMCDAIESARQAARHDIVSYYGGTAMGLIGQYALVASANGAKVISIISKGLLSGVGKRPVNYGIVEEGGIGYSEAWNAADFCMGEDIVLDISDRKRVFLKVAQGHLVLAGGNRTKDEAIQAISMTELKKWSAPEDEIAPIIYLNRNGCYEPTRQQFLQDIQDGMVSESLWRFVFFENTPDAVFQRLKSWQKRTKEAGPFLARDLL